ncbi:FAD-dependent oxidoreductase [Paenibacillus macerans]|uniref:FAD dependent oxidoreductase family protein n=1 Tax=Paenibacillus macerans TaxID=44252 RepID=A0A090Y6J4_PAEMA|nr:FAD-dependent oxidoreductase [Paenibacillus macerans]KFM93821.1 FAD dependent oxidoreductase family protein [Paenibacillus macerans]MCY7562077.1 FAD-dependent oxidoreductase [Paenibacillus macerans]MEC0153832.1 FAD-dependent oxidoreductase [Paenibacillus macerans]SUA86339.1 pyridine nucleotide-disulfide oxidoreductase [Paenibacillus macerans]GBK66036.1 FAD-dependent oxidoreductase [Paenibacillus macerans]
MRNETVQSDITVVGGGLAGVCAAVAAARLGKKVALVQNRPVLGGNSSSEVRVWVCGATAHGVNRYARETGIMDEMFVENQYRNPDGNPYLWDTVVLETVLAEPNITLYLNTDVHEVEAEDLAGDEPEGNSEIKTEGAAKERRIRSVTGWMMGSERRIRFESPLFLDCTGDGLIGLLAGAKYRLGREGRGEYGEIWAPGQPDNITLGSTLLFYTKDAGHPVKFVPPSFAKDITQTPIPLNRVIRSGDSGCHYWWIEWGGELDTVHDNERIRDELWAVIYGIWDYIKNSGLFDADNMTLEWVGSVPGKREYRRFIGDYVLTQNDILAQEPFEDRVAFGGWSIDLHPPQGMYAAESGSKHLHADGNYHIPFRSLYSVNVSNLLFAGRNISATHVAFGTTRVMATCAVIGEAAGTAAALCADKGVTPRELSREHTPLLLQTLLKQDASVLGLANEDAGDLARQAKISASSFLSRLAVESADEAYPLEHDVAILLPADPGIAGNIEWLLDALEDTELTVEVWSTGRPENYVPAALEYRTTVSVTKGEGQWIAAALDWTPAEAQNAPQVQYASEAEYASETQNVSAVQNAFIIVRSNPSVRLYLSHTPLTGLLAFERGAGRGVSKDLEDHDYSQPVVEWSMKRLVRKVFCFRADFATDAYRPEQIIDGYKRPYGGPHMWLSEPMAQDAEPWVTLKWENEQTVREIHLIFNDDVNEDLINLHHHRTPFEIIPELVKNYRIDMLDPSGSWSTLIAESGNRRRKRVHRLEAAIQMKALRLIVEETNGSEYAEVIEVRVYG